MGGFLWDLLIGKDYSFQEVNNRGYFYLQAEEVSALSLATFKDICRKLGGFECFWCVVTIVVVGLFGMVFVHHKNSITKWLNELKSSQTVTSNCLISNQAIQGDGKDMRVSVLVNVKSLGNDFHSQFEKIATTADIAVDIRPNEVKFDGQQRNMVLSQQCGCNEWNGHLMEDSIEASNQSNIVLDDIDKSEYERDMLQQATTMLERVKSSSIFCNISEKTNNSMSENEKRQKIHQWLDNRYQPSVLADNDPNGDDVMYLKSKQCEICMPTDNSEFQFTNSETVLKKKPKLHRSRRNRHTSIVSKSNQPRANVKSEITSRRHRWRSSNDQDIDYFQQGDCEIFTDARKRVTTIDKYNSIRDNDSDISSAFSDSSVIESNFKRGLGSNARRKYSRRSGRESKIVNFLLHNTKKTRLSSSESMAGSKYILKTINGGYVIVSNPDKSLHNGGKQSLISTKDEDVSPHSNCHHWDGRQTAEEVPILKGKALSSSDDIRETNQQNTEENMDPRRLAVGNVLCKSTRKSSENCAIEGTESRKIIACSTNEKDTVRNRICDNAYKQTQTRETSTINDESPKWFPTFHGESLDKGRTTPPQDKRYPNILSNSKLHETLKNDIEKVLQKQIDEFYDSIQDSKYFEYENRTKHSATRSVKTFLLKNKNRNLDRSRTNRFSAKNSKVINYDLNSSTPNFESCISKSKGESWDFDVMGNVEKENPFENNASTDSTAKYDIDIGKENMDQAKEGKEAQHRPKQRGFGQNATIRVHDHFDQLERRVNTTIKEQKDGIRKILVNDFGNDVKSDCLIELPDQLHEKAIESRDSLTITPIQNRQLKSGITPRRISLIPRRIINSHFPQNDTQNVNTIMTLSDTEDTDHINSFYQSVGDNGETQCNGETMQSQLSFIPNDLPVQHVECDFIDESKLLLIRKPDALKACYYLDSHTLPVNTYGKTESQTLNTRYRSKNTQLSKDAKRHNDHFNLVKGSTQMKKTFTKETDSEDDVIINSTTVARKVDSFLTKSNDENIQKMHFKTLESCNNFGQPEEMTPQYRRKRELEKLPLTDGYSDYEIKTSRLDISEMVKRFVYVDPSEVTEPKDTHSISINERIPNTPQIKGTGQSKNHKVSSHGEMNSLNFESRDTSSTGSHNRSDISYGGLNTKGTETNTSFDNATQMNEKRFVLKLPQETQPEKRHRVLSCVGGDIVPESDKDRSNDICHTTITLLENDFDDNTGYSYHGNCSAYHEVITKPLGQTHTSDLSCTERTNTNTKTSDPQDIIPLFATHNNKEQKTHSYDGNTNTQLQFKENNEHLTITSPTAIDDSDLHQDYTIKVERPHHCKKVKCSFDELAIVGATELDRTARTKGLRHFCSPGDNTDIAKTHRRDVLPGFDVDRTVSFTSKPKRKHCLSLSTSSHNKRGDSMEEGSKYIFPHYSFTTMDGISKPLIRKKNADNRQQFTKINDKGVGDLKRIPGIKRETGAFTGHAMRNDIRLNRYSMFSPREVDLNFDNVSKPEVVELEEALNSPPIYEDTAFFGASSFCSHQSPPSSVIENIRESMSIETHDSPKENSLFSDEGRTEGGVKSNPVDSKLGTNGINHSLSANYVFTNKLRNGMGDGSSDNKVHIDRTDISYEASPTWNQISDATYVKCDIGSMQDFVDEKDNWNVTESHQIWPTNCKIDRSPKHKTDVSMSTKRDAKINNFNEEIIGRGFPPHHHTMIESETDGSQLLNNSKKIEHICGQGDAIRWPNNEAIDGVGKDSTENYDTKLTLSTDGTVLKSPLSTSSVKEYHGLIKSGKNTTAKKCNSEEGNSQLQNLQSQLVNLDRMSRKKSFHGCHLSNKNENKIYPRILENRNDREKRMSKRGISSVDGMNESDGQEIEDNIMFYGSYSRRMELDDLDTIIDSNDGIELNYYSSSNGNSLESWCDGTYTIATLGATRNIFGNGERHDDSPIAQERNSFRTEIEFKTPKGKGLKLTEMMRNDNRKMSSTTSGKSRSKVENTSNDVATEELCNDNPDGGDKEMRSPSSIAIVGRTAQPSSKSHRNSKTFLVDWYRPRPLGSSTRGSSGTFSNERRRRRADECPTEVDNNVRSRRVYNDDKNIKTDDNNKNDDYCVNDNHIIYHDNSSNDGDVSGSDLSRNSDSESESSKIETSHYRNTMQ